MFDLRSLMPEINCRRGISYAGGLVAIGVIYFALAKAGLALASIHPSATPIWPPTLTLHSLTYLARGYVEDVG